MAEKNATILRNIWLNGTNDFQQRIPEPTQNNIAKTVDELFNPMNASYYNQFVDSLVMRIGMTYVHQQSFRNPLAVFKQGKLMYGNSIQEFIPKWIKAHSYVDDAEDIFKMARPDFSAWYHSQNRRDRYDITINDSELRTAFTDSYGLNKTVAALLNVPMNSDEYDEYRIMLQLIAFYNDRWGFYRHHLSASPSDEATGKEFLKAVKTYAGKLAFPNTIYNSSQLDDIPIFAKAKELVLLITPEVQANVDVETLSSVFQLDKANISYRTIQVDEFPIPNAVALLTTEDFFQCRDTEYRTTSMYNPKTLGTNYFLHHWGIYSVSPFVPAILFTTDAATTVPVVTQGVTGLRMDIADAAPDKGDSVQLTLKLQGTITPKTGSINVAPDSAVFRASVTRASGDSTTAVNSPSTRVDEYGVLHVSKSLEYGDAITVEATATYINPSGATTKYTAKQKATVTKK